MFKVVAGRQTKPAYNLTGCQPTKIPNFCIFLLLHILLRFFFSALSYFSCSFILMLMIFIFKFANINWLHIGGWLIVNCLTGAEVDDDGNGDGVVWHGMA